jgi:hypothetical protein
MLHFKIKIVLMLIKTIYLILIFKNNVKETMHLEIIFEQNGVIAKQVVKYCNHMDPY